MKGIDVAKMVKDVGWAVSLDIGWDEQFERQSSLNPVGDAGRVFGV